MHINEYIEEIQNICSDNNITFTYYQANTRNELTLYFGKGINHCGISVRIKDILTIPNTYLIMEIKHTLIKYNLIKRSEL